MNFRTDFLKGLKPSREGLFELILPDLDDSLILKMAMCDVPFQEEVRANQDALNEIKKSRKVPGNLQWNPAEVCNLLRWDREVSDRETNLMGLFACWILINAYTQIDSQKNGMVDEGDQHTLVRIVELGFAMGEQYQNQILSLLSWAYQEIEPSQGYRVSERPFYLFALLLLCGFEYSRAPRRPITEIYEYLQDQESNARRWIEEYRSWSCKEDGYETWVLGLESDVNGNWLRWREAVRQVVSSLEGREQDSALDLFKEISVIIG